MVGRPSATFRLLRGVAYQPWVNAVVQWALRPWAAWIPERILRRVPIVGHVTISLPGGREVRLAARGGDVIVRCLFWGGRLDYEATVRRVFCHLVPGSGTVVVVGANTGLYALIAAVEAPAATVYAFEPLPAAFSELARNVRENGLTNVVGEPLAVADRTAGRTLFVPVSERYIPTTASLKIDTEGRERIDVEAVSLDDYVGSHGIRGVDFLKIDAEEAEVEVLTGATGVIRQHRPIVLCEVTTRRVGEAVASLLAPLEYQWFWISHRGLVPQAELRAVTRRGEMDYLLVPVEKVAQVPMDLMAD